MTVNELLIELIRLTLEDRGNFQVQVELEDKWEDIGRTTVVESFNKIVLE